MSEFDALLHAATLLRPEIDMKLLPAVLKTHAEWGSHNRSNPYEVFEQTCFSSVYPFTQDHGDVLLKRREKDSLKKIYP